MVRAAARWLSIWLKALSQWLEGLVARPIRGEDPAVAALRQRYPGAPDHWLRLIAARTAEAQMRGHPPGELALPARQAPAVANGIAEGRPDRNIAQQPEAFSRRPASVPSAEPTPHRPLPARHGRRIRIIWSELGDQEPEVPIETGSPQAASDRSAAPETRPQLSGLSEPGAPEWRAAARRRPGWVERILGRAQRRRVPAETHSAGRQPRGAAEQAWAMQPMHGSAEALATFGAPPAASPPPLAPLHRPLSATAAPPAWHGPAAANAPADPVRWPEGPRAAHRGTDTQPILAHAFPPLPESLTAEVFAGTSGPSPRIVSPLHAGDTPWSG